MYVTGCWGSPAIFGSVFHSKRRVLGLDLTFPSDWKKWVWVSEFSAAGGEGGEGRRWRWCQEKVLFSVRQWLIVIVAPHWSPWDGRSAEGIHHFGEFLSLEPVHIWRFPKVKAHLTTHHLAPAHIFDCLTSECCVYLEIKQNQPFLPEDCHCKKNPDPKQNKKRSASHFDFLGSALQQSGIKRAALQQQSSVLKKRPQP